MKNLLFLFLLILLPIKANADQSGTCGENLTWTYESATQTLTISGTGVMYNYSEKKYVNGYKTNAPWGNDDITIRNLIIDNGVTYIGTHAFHGLSSLTLVNISNSVSSIGYSAFMSCYNLTTVNIPNSVTFIDNSAFEGCI